MTPRLSIVISTRNRAQLLERTLASIAGHAYDDAEVVVVDDGSSDDTAALCAKLPWVRYERFRDGGDYRQNPGAPINRGMALATAPVVVQQCAEVVHVTRVADELASAVRPGRVAFATVVDAPASDLPRIAEAVERGWPVVPDLVPPVGQDLFPHPTELKIPGLGCQRFYCGPQRTFPAFFCGAIMAGDWRRVGEYDDLPIIGSDTRYVPRMIAGGLEFVFLGAAIAVHQRHHKS